MIADARQVKADASLYSRIAHHASVFVAQGLEPWICREWSIQDAAEQGAH